MIDKALAVLKAGGFTLIFIILLSVIALALAIERSAALWRFLDRARALGETVKRCLYRGALAEARTACERSSSPMADLYLIGFERLGRSTASALENAVERERQRVAIALKGPTWMLGTIGATAPFIGLFGTVVGIMRAFNEIGAQHKAGIDVVGPGISEALITTAFGIVVGIEAVMIFNYFSAKLLRTSLELKLMSEEFVEILQESRDVPQETAAAPGEKGKKDKKDTKDKKEKVPTPPPAAAAELPVDEEPA